MSPPLNNFFSIQLGQSETQPNAVAAGIHLCLLTQIRGRLGWTRREDQCPTLFGLYTASAAPRLTLLVALPPYPTFGEPTL